MNSRSNPSRLRLWWNRFSLATLIWTAVGLIFALPGVAYNHTWREPLMASLAQWWSWGLLAPLIVNVDLWLPFSSKQMVRRVIAHLFLGPAFTAVYVYLFAAVAAAMRLAPWSRLADGQLLVNAFRGMFLWSALVYCLIVGLWQAFHNHQRYLNGELRMERLERSFSEARLNVLRMQLDPHFLFNALNTISAQLEREPRLARQMIEHLGDLLRLSLENKDRHEVPLLEEMAFLDHYLAIQKIRFGDRLRFNAEIEPGVKHAVVPCLLIQPLVENAIRHGISSRSSGGTVAVSARRVAGQELDQLEIRVTDDGVGLPKGWTLENSAGLGLSVTKERIRVLYPNGASRFTVRGIRQARHEYHGTEAVILLPLRFASETNAALDGDTGHGSAAD